MIQVIPVRHDASASNKRVRTHILSPHDKATITFTIEWEQENILSILEDHILETISGIEWNSHSDSDFKFLTENYNRFIRNLESEDLDTISVIVSLLRGNTLTISAIGNATAYLVEGDDISQITTPELGRHDFHTLTEGEVSRSAAIYLANTNIGEILGTELMSELSELSGQEFSEVASEIFQREINETIHLVRIAHSFKSVQNEIKTRGRGQLHLLKNQGAKTVNYVKNLPVWGNLKNRIDNINFKENTQQKYIYLAFGVIVIFFLFVIIIQAFSNALGTSNNNEKTQLLQAQELIETSLKLTNNPTQFNENIKQAEQILATLQQENKYINDVQSLREKIEVAKKEIYDIQTIDLTKKTSILPLENSNFIPMFTFEVNNKLLVIGKNGIIHDYVRNTQLPKVIEYPDNDTAESASINDAGVPYIAMNSGKVVTKRQESAVYVKTNGQDAWESNNHIVSFNGNIYTINEEKNQIYKYRPSANGFGAKANVLPNLSSTKIADIAIDGGFYLVLEDGRIGRYLSTNEAAGIVGLTLNEIPSAWTIDASTQTQIIANEKLSYVYILNGKNIWIFQPNSKNFKDVNALTYVAQIELQSNENVTNISVPRDGLLYFTTEKGVFESQFEISNNKLILK